MTKTTTSTAIRRVLAPVDGSALSEAILDPLERLLDPAQPATVFLLEVLDRDRGAPDRDAAIERVRDYLGRVERRFRDPHVAFELHVRAGDAAEQILAMSEEVDVDLIAMSTLGRDGVERWVAGSVTERVLRQAKAPVLLANPGDATRWEEGFRRVLVPLDGSRRSEAILPRVETVARRFGSEVVLFHAVEHDEDDTRVCLANVERQVERLRHAGLHARLETAAGAASALILAAAERDATQLVAMTTHGWTGFDRWALGSVAETVARRCCCPLLVARS